VVLLDRSVLITGASGGVGYFACQLAAQAGAIVTAQVRRPELVEFVTKAKAHPSSNMHYTIWCLIL
jgi:NADPH:quinone reductase-like Zn-dependent oxidoreductase